MPGTRSINQNLTAHCLPDFRNIGTMLRIVVSANICLLVFALFNAGSLGELADGLLQMSAVMQPVLLTALVLLYLAGDRLAHFKCAHAVTGVTVLVAMVVVLVDALLSGALYGPGEFKQFHYAAHMLVSMIFTLAMLRYFQLRSGALSPATQEARLQALQARIRPHFLFNTINAVLSIVRSEPKKAEQVLEDMSDLFRMAMSEPKSLVLLSKEIELARQYLAIEHIRMGERLRVNWHMSALPEDAMIPPLILQPLLENAVYHGIEPLSEGGDIDIRLQHTDDGLFLEVSNPVGTKKAHQKGSRIALANIRERLDLLFDVEARYQVEAGEGFYRVSIDIPDIRGGQA